MSSKRRQQAMDALNREVRGWQADQELFDSTVDRESDAPLAMPPETICLQRIGPAFREVVRKARSSDEHRWKNGPKTRANGLQRRATRSDSRASPAKALDDRPNTRDDRPKTREDRPKTREDRPMLLDDRSKSREDRPKTLESRPKTRES